MKIFITTDTHFGHEKLIEYGRPKNFEDKIRKALVNQVSRDDLLIHLGDICIGDSTLHSNWFKDTLKCRTCLIKGNHDRKSVSWYLDNGWDVVANRLDVELFGKRISFTHCPIKWDRSFDINYHGHFHDTNHRKFDSEFNKILSHRNRLIALEHMHYQPFIINQKI